MQYLIDTNLLIDFLRGNPNAKKFIENASEPIIISAVTVAELYAGVREGNETIVLDALISTCEVISINKNIATLGGLIRRDYSRSHGIGIADALIAATAKERNAILVTLNKKHFPMLERVLFPYEDIV